MSVLVDLRPGFKSESPCAWNRLCDQISDAQLAVKRGSLVLSPGECLIVEKTQPRLIFGVFLIRPVFQGLEPHLFGLRLGRPSFLFELYAVLDFFELLVLFLREGTFGLAIQLQSFCT